MVCSVPFVKRIAYCSPVNPLSSGISDYSEELLPYLARYAEVVLFVPDGVTPVNARLRQALEVLPLADLPRLHTARPFDALIYHIGNSPVHAEIYEHALRLPGVVVLHEWVLHHFKLWHAASRLGDVGQYHREMADRYGERGKAIAQRMARGQLLDAAFEMPLVEDIVRSATGLIAHSDYVVDRAHELRPGLPAVVVPMGVPVPPLLDPFEARRRLGLPAHITLWASFGHINPYKRMEVALRAFRHFLRWEPESRYVLVGSVSPSYDLDAVIRRLGLADFVSVTGYASPAAFADYVAASDLCLNLRYPTAGETSASLLRLLGAAKPTLVSAIGALDELPDYVCAKVDPGTAESEQILAYGRLLRLAPRIARTLGQNARRFVASMHSLEGAAQGYIQFLSRLQGWDNVAPRRPPLWEIETWLPTSSNISSDRDASDSVFAAAAPTSIDPTISGSLRQLAMDTGSALGELGMAAQDSALVDVAGIVADLFEISDPGGSAL